MSLKEFFNAFTDICHPMGTADFEWSSKGVGFGGLYFYVSEYDGYVHCGNEAMSREFIKKILCDMVDQCVLDCPGSFDEGTEGKPPGYTPRPILSDNV